MEPVNYESAIALSKFDKGQLQEIRVYPIWGRQDGPISRRGLPMPATAPSDCAAQFCSGLQQTVSDAFGTKIAIEGNVGVIRPSPTVSSGP